MATLTGLEPATSAVTGRRANQLRYRAMRIQLWMVLGGARCAVLSGAVLLRYWRPQRDSNPCCRRERAVS